MDSHTVAAFGGVLAALLSLTLFVLLWRAVRRRRSWDEDESETPLRRPHRGSVGPGAAGAVYGFLNEDKRAAIEIIVEERTAYRDPEDRDGHLPDLEHRT
jgi:hypothetical protein